MLNPKIIHRIPLPDERVTLVAHNRGDQQAYADLWLMTLCQHFVIGNCTFRWWGTWLAAHPVNRLLKYFRDSLFENFRPHKTAYKPLFSSG